MLVALTALFFFIALLLMIIILLQPGGGGGLGFIGGGSQSAFGTKTGNVMTKITTTLAALFLLVSFVLGYLNARQGRVETKEIMKLNKEAQESPAQQAPEETQLGEIGVDISDTNE